MHTTRYARESHTRAYLANDNDCSNFYPPRASTIHHPLASPTPRSHRASALGPLCMLTCSSDVPRRKVGAWEFGRAQLGAVLLGPMCAALSSDVPTERWGVGVRAHNGTVCCSFACCSARCAPPELGRAPPTGGAVGVRVHNGAICFAPCVRWPPICV